MSGSHLVEQAEETSSKSTEPEDHAASLRAAALLTLKSKRRKLINASDTVVVQPPSIQLDYGSEEPHAGPSSSPAVRPVAPESTTSESMDVDGGQAREEGEISDSETSPPASMPDPPSPRSIQHERAITPKPLLLKPKIEPAAPVFSSAVPFSPITTSAFVDDQHVRPGLAMTQAQYDTAKDIVLDLLGWGVPPEYLVNCGLSREIVYYVFVELNLRLPANLDLADLSGLAPPTSTFSAATSVPSAIGHASLPPKPTGESVLPLSATAAAFVPTSNVVNGTPSSPNNLHDMEQRRRQELLARKAVLASRKVKQPKSISSDSQSVNDSPPSASVTAVNGDGEGSIAVPTKTVDDFLKSIEPVTPTTAISQPPSSEASADPPSTFSSDAMNVDEVPGLSGITDYTPNVRPSATQLSSVSQSSRPPAISHPPVSSASDRSYPSALMYSAVSGVLPYDDVDIIPGLFQTSSSHDDCLGATRRGTKRPVAADFVDMESGPSHTVSRGPSSSESFRPLVRRKTTGFAGILQRRCVIELSDSEEELDDDPRLNGMHTRPVSRGPRHITPQESFAPTPRVDSPASSVGTPAALQEKEEAIRRMRELIAHREQNRLRKLALTSRPAASSNVQTNGGIFIKQEDDESVPSQSSEPSRSSSSVTPVPAGRPSDTSEENSVVAALLPDHTNGNANSFLEREPTSTAETPTEISLSLTTLDHPATGDKVLTNEAQREQAIIGEEDHHEHSDVAEVDVVGTRPETSAQVAPETIDNTEDLSLQAPVFQTYHSILDRHPLLRSIASQGSSSVLPFASSDVVHGGAPSSTPHLELKPLKQTAVLHYLSDNTRRVCHYELGGECRDKNCENVHLSRLSAVEPSDEDTAQFLCASTPAGQRFGVEVFRKALDVARLSHPTMPFDARVQEALTRLGFR